MFFYKLLIVSTLLNYIKSENIQCIEKFRNEMNKINEVNMTLKELREHIFIANYYSFTVFNKNKNKNNINYNELKYLENICNINYEKLDFNDIKNKIIISKDSKNKLLKLIETKKNLYEFIYKIYSLFTILILTYIFTKYPFTALIYILYHYIITMLKL